MRVLSFLRIASQTAALVTLREELNLVGQEQSFDEFREGFASLTHSLSHLIREIAEAVAVRGRNVDPSSLQHVFQKLDRALTAEAQKQAFFQRKELERTTRHLIEEASSLAEIVSELKSGQPSFLSRRRHGSGRDRKGSIPLPKSGITCLFVPAVFATHCDLESPLL